MVIRKNPELGIYFTFSHPLLLASLPHTPTTQTLTAWHWLVSNVLGHLHVFKTMLALNSTELRLSLPTECWD